MLRSIVRPLLIVALLAPVTAAQQSAASDHGSHHGQQAKPALDAELAEHFKGITLTDDQVKRITEIKAKHHKAMDALKKEAKDPNDPSLKAELQKQMDAEHAAFKALLTPEQAKLFDENMKAHHKAEGKHEMKPGMKHDMKREAKAAPRKP